MHTAARRGTPTPCCECCELLGGGDGGGGGGGEAGHQAAAARAGAAAPRSATPRSQLRLRLGPGRAAPQAISQAQHAQRDDRTLVGLDGQQRYSRGGQARRPGRGLRKTAGHRRRRPCRLPSGDAEAWRGRAEDQGQAGEVVRSSTLLRRRRRHCHRRTANRRPRLRGGAAAAQAGRCRGRPAPPLALLPCCRWGRLATINLGRSSCSRRGSGPAAAAEVAAANTEQRPL